MQVSVEFLGLAYPYDAIGMHCVSPRLAFPALGSVWYAAHGGASRWTYEARGTGIDTSRGSSWIPAGGLDEWRSLPLKRADTCDYLTTDGVNWRWYLAIFISAAIIMYELRSVSLRMSRLGDHRVRAFEAAKSFAQSTCVFSSLAAVKVGALKKAVEEAAKAKWIPPEELYNCLSSAHPKFQKIITSWSDKDEKVLNGVRLIPELTVGSYAERVQIRRARRAEKEGGDGDETAEQVLACAIVKRHRLLDQWVPWGNEGMAKQARIFEREAVKADAVDSDKIDPDGPNAESEEERNREDLRGALEAMKDILTRCIVNPSAGGAGSSNSPERGDASSLVPATRDSVMRLLQKHARLNGYLRRFLARASCVSPDGDGMPELRKCIEMAAPSKEVKVIAELFANSKDNNNKTSACADLRIKTTVSLHGLPAEGEPDECGLHAAEEETDSSSPRQFSTPTAADYLGYWTTNTSFEIVVPGNFADGWGPLWNVHLGGHARRQARVLDEMLLNEYKQLGFIPDPDMRAEHALKNIHWRLLEARYCYLEHCQDLGLISTKMDEQPYHELYSEALCSLVLRQMSESGIFAGEWLARVLDNVLRNSEMINGKGDLPSNATEYMLGDPIRVFDPKIGPQDVPGIRRYRVHWQWLMCGNEKIRAVRGNPFQYNFDDWNDAAFYDVKRVAGKKAPSSPPILKKRFRESSGVFVLMDYIIYWHSVLMFGSWIVAAAWYLYRVRDNLSASDVEECIVGEMALAIPIGAVFLFVFVFVFRILQDYADKKTREYMRETIMFRIFYVSGAIGAFAAGAAIGASLADSNSGWLCERLSDSYVWSSRYWASVWDPNTDSARILILFLRTEALCLALLHSIGYLSQAFIPGMQRWPQRCFGRVSPGVLNPVELRRVLGRFLDYKEAWLLSHIVQCVAWFVVTIVLFTIKLTSDNETEKMIQNADFGTDKTLLEAVRATELSGPQNRVVPIWVWYYVFVRMAFDTLQWLGKLGFNVYILGKPMSECLRERPVYMPGTALSRLEHHAMNASAYSIQRGIGAVLARDRRQPREDVQKDEMFTPGSRVYSDLVQKRTSRSARQQLMRTGTWGLVFMASLYFMLNYVTPSVDNLDSVCRSRCNQHGAGEDALLNFLSAYSAAPRTDCAGCAIAVFLFFILGTLTSFVVIDAAFKALLALLGTYRGLKSGIQGMRQPDISQKLQFYKPGGNGALAADGESMQAVLGPRWPAAWERIVRELHENDEVTKSEMQRLIDMTNAQKGAALQLADLPRVAQEQLTFFYRTVKRIEKKFTKKVSLHLTIRGG